MKKLILFFLVLFFTDIVFVAVKSLAQEPAKKVTTIKGCPNPSNGMFTVQIENPGKTFSVLVYNTLGEKISERNYIASNNETIAVDISSFKKGVYFLVYKDDKDQIVREKVVTY